ncbi:MAG TPA: c-type cytochrome [Terriglobales bacterium]|nr:c-type cytochrome [Terriglobales bacterium]
MRRLALFVLCCASLAGAQESCRTGTEIQLPPACGVQLPNPRIACTAPADADLDASNNPNVQHRAVDIFAWQLFLDMNWPAGTRRGEPDPEKPIGAPGRRVWETWKEASEVYLPNGRKPAPWQDSPSKSLVKRLFRTQKVDDVLDAAVQPTGADGTLPITLTDQHGRTVYYEIRMNRVAFDFVVGHRLYDSRVQEQAGPVAFPDGAILVKAAWRQLEPGEESRYYTRAAQICDKHERECATHTVGLVGFHIMIRTRTAPQWIWATFEQVENVRGPKPSFSDPACRDCAAVTNRQTPAGVPNQVVRATPIPATDPVCSERTFDDNVVAMNRDVAAALARQGAVLANYELVGAQWPFAPGRPETVFQVTPPILANTTMETFIQETSSCMGCHAMARTTRRQSFASADFTFTLNDAGPVLPALPAFTPLHPHSAANQRAVAISQHTFEMVPAPHVVAKLHCGSCHLNAGTNPRAAWWVGSADRLKTRSGLFYRINQCFRNSMNGAAICGSDAECASDPNMMALTAYIEDLTAAWHKQHGKEPAPASFPKIASKTPDPARGRSIYRQKCAFCHGADGEGRYASGTYYRPALWGPDSFDANAGMADPMLLAPFLHANMPLGSGGELTEQEAWDIAGFIDAQCRPKKSGCPAK